MNAFFPTPFLSRFLTELSARLRLALVVAPLSQGKVSPSLSLPVAALVASVGALFFPFDAARAAESDELTSIFSGKDLAGWQAPDPNPFWRVVEGVLIGENDPAKRGHVLYTKQSYQDFIIEAEARWTGEIDSGIMLRQPELQLQIGISRSLKTDMTCSFYTNGKEKYPEPGRARNLQKFLKPGDWNRIRLQAKGDTFTVWLNGEKVTEYKDARFPNPAPIGLQIHPGLTMKVEFRNIRLKELDNQK